MSTLYSDEHRRLQDAHDSRKLADLLLNAIVAAEINEEHRKFIESRDLFFLSTVDHRGYPTCSYKGGYPGFVRVLDPRTLAFPIYDGNGMYLSAGNIGLTSKVGLLFIDFVRPHRVRVHGDASVDNGDPLLQSYDRANYVVRVQVREIFVNCGRYIHKHERKSASPYVPKDGCEVPFPGWKRIDVVQDALPQRDRGLAEKLGGTITQAEYQERVDRGDP